MDSKYMIVFVTAPTGDDGCAIARALVREKLAACVNVMTPVISMYTWEGEINRDEEMLLIVKSRVDLFERDLIPAVKAVHPYNVPEIIALPIIMGSEDYLGWIKDVTRQD